MSANIRPPLNAGNAARVGVLIPPYNPAADLLESLEDLAGHGFRDFAAAAGRATALPATCWVC